MKHLIEKAAVLHEALPYIRTFHGEIFVIKYGGSAMVDPVLRDSFARDIVLMKYVGLNPIVVHGGGPQIDEKLSALGVDTSRVNGLRITSEAAMEVVEMVLGGKVNQEIVSLIGNNGGRPVGLTGKDDGGFLRGEKLEPVTTADGKSVDLGRVGRIRHINPDVVRRLVLGGFIPVIAPIAVDTDGHALNVNADTVAGELAQAIGARKLVLLTDTAGVRGSDGEVSSALNAADVDRLEAEGVIAGGMIPKVRCALEAVAGGVKKAHIIDGRQKHAVLLELFTDEGIGTQITG